MKLEIDADRQILTIEGIRYAYELFGKLGFCEPGTVFEVVERKNGIITLKNIIIPAPGAEKVQTRA